MTSSVSSRRRLDTSSTTAKNASRESVRLLPRELIASNRYASARVGSLVQELRELSVENDDLSGVPNLLREEANASSAPTSNTTEACKRAPTGTQPATSSPLVSRGGTTGRGTSQ